MIERKGKKWLVYDQNDGSKVGAFTTHQEALNASKAMSPKTPTVKQTSMPEKGAMNIPDVARKGKGHKKG